MTTKNTLEKSFGPAGTTAGIFIFITGIITTLFISTGGLILLLIGGFIGFTSSCTLIDYDKRRVKYSHNLFGVIKTGKWFDIESGMKIGIKKSDRVWRAYSRTNRIVEIDSNQYRIILYDSDGDWIMPLKNAGSSDMAKAELERMAEQLGTGLI